MTKRLNFLITGSSHAFKFFLVVILAFTTLCSWALASPVASSPDDDFHLSSIWCSGDGYRGMCEKSEVPSERKVSRALIESACYAHDPTISAGCQNDLAVLRDNTLLTSTRGNFNGGYPPVYYSFMHLFASTDVELSVFVMRIVNVLIFLLLGVLIWIYGPRSTRNMQTIPWLITCIPLGIFVLASNNPSSWGFTGIGMSALALYSLISSQGEPLLNKSILAVVYFLSSLIASGARGDSALFSVLTSGIIVFLTFSTWNKLLKFLPLVIFTTTTALILYFSSSAATSVARVGVAPENVGVSPFSVLTQNLLSLPDLFIGIFGVWGLGWLDTPMPQLVWVTTSFIFVGFVAIAWQRQGIRRIIAQLIVVTALIALPLYILQKEMATVGQFLQPRYFLPLILLLAILVFESLSVQKFNPSRFFKLVVWAGLSIAQSISLYLNLDRYVHGTGISTGFNLNHSIQWWWSGSVIGPMQVFILGSIAFSALSFLLIDPLKKNKTELLGYDFDLEQNIKTNN